MPHTSQKRASVLLPARRTVQLCFLRVHAPDRIEQRHQDAGTADEDQCEVKASPRYIVVAKDDLDRRAPPGARCGSEVDWYARLVWRVSGARSKAFC